MFILLLPQWYSHFLLQALIHGIFETIVDQSPFAIEDIMNELTGGSDNDLSEEEWSDEESKLIAKGKDLPTMICCLIQAGLL